MNVIINLFYRMKKYFQAPWSIKDILLVTIFAGIMVGVLALTLKYSGLGEIADSSERKGLIIAGIFILQWIAIFLPLILITRKKYKLKWEHFGFKRISVKKTIALVIGSYLLFIGISILIGIFIILTDIRIPGYQVQDDILPLFGEGLTNLIIAGVLITVVAPLIEEIFFRGFLLRTISGKIGIVWGSIVAALIFAALHMPWQSFIPIFILGIIINRIVINSKSLWPAIVFHMLNNAIVFAFLLALENNLIDLEELVIMLT
ncbi:MAG: type II CAAX endopeptidase family protein [bacterium]|nr:type II CAAX endopeptidase family protein [bacterium]